MNRSDIIQLLQKRTGLTPKEADWLVRRFFDSLAEGLRRDGRVELRGFGVFKLSTRKQAGFQNPKDGKYYGGVDLKTIKFYPSSLVEKEGL